MRFDENELYWQNSGSLNYKKENEIDQNSFEIELENLVPSSDQTQQEQSPHSLDSNQQIEAADLEQSAHGNLPHLEPELFDYQLTHDRQRRTMRPPSRYEQADCNIEKSDPAAYALICNEEIMGSEPSSYNEAMNSAEKEQWSKEMLEEMTSLYRNDKWKLMQKPKGQ